MEATIDWKYGYEFRAVSAVPNGLGMEATIDWKYGYEFRAVSASLEILAIIFTLCTGYLPLATSPDNITQSDPSSTALATSDTSARVGLGFLIIDSNICVATITGFPTMLHLEIIIFCAKNTFSAAISIPKSPRATMTPSTSRRMESKLRTPS